MTTVREYAIEHADSDCSTEGVRPLNDQIFALAQPVLISDLVPCADIVQIVGGSTMAFLQPAAKAALAGAVAEKGESLSWYTRIGRWLTSTSYITGSIITNYAV